MNTFDVNFYKGKKVLVTGHTGFKGSWLCRILLDLGAEVTGYALEPPTEPDIFSLLKLESQMHSVVGDIRDLEKLKAVFAEAQPEIVLHLAAQPIVQKSGIYLRNQCHGNGKCTGSSKTVRQCEIFPECDNG